MKKTKCVECKEEIEYMEIVASHIQDSDGTRVGCHDLMGDNYCPKCELEVFGEDESWIL